MTRRHEQPGPAVAGPFSGRAGRAGPGDADSAFRIPRRAARRAPEQRTVSSSCPHAARAKEVGLIRFVVPALEARSTCSSRFTRERPRGGLRRCRLVPRARGR